MLWSSLCSQLLHCLNNNHWIKTITITIIHFLFLLKNEQWWYHHHCLIASQQFSYFRKLYLFIYSCIFMLWIPLVGGFACHKILQPAAKYLPGCTAVTAATMYSASFPVVGCVSVFLISLLRPKNWKQAISPQLWYEVCRMLWLSPTMFITTKTGALHRPPIPTVMPLTLPKDKGALSP